MQVALKFSRDAGVSFVPLVQTLTYFAKPTIRAISPTAGYDDQPFVVTVRAPHIYTHIKL